MPTLNRFAALPTVFFPESNEPARPVAARPVSHDGGGQAAGESAVRTERQGQDRPGRPGLGNRRIGVTVHASASHTAWKIENVLTLALLKGLRLVHFFRGPLKELAKAISGSAQAAAARR